MTYLENYPVETIGVADLDPSSPVVIQAKKRGLFVTQDYPKLLELSDLDLIINLSPDKTMQMVVEQLKPEGSTLIQISDPACLTASLREWILTRELSKILRQLANCLSGIRNVKEALGDVLKSLIILCNAQAAGLWLKQGSDFVLFVEVTLPESFRNYPGAGVGHRALGILSEERAAVIVNDFKARTDFPDREIFLSSGITGLIMLPILKDGEVTGALLIMTARTVGPDLEALTGLLQSLLGLIAESLEGVERTSQLITPLTKDQITGLHNEAYLQERLEEQISQAWRKGHCFSLLCIKILLGTKTIKSKDPAFLNAQLRKSSREIRACIRKMDIPAGSKAGDLFLMLPETGPVQALEIAKRIIARLDGIDLRDGEGHPLKYGLGLACFPDHGTSPMELLENAGRAAERAAEEGLKSLLVRPELDQHLLLMSPYQMIGMYPSLKEVLGLLWELREVEKEFWDHALGVAYYAGRLGQSLGLDEQSVRDLQVSGWLHDLGKMGIFFHTARLSKQFPRLAEVDRQVHAAVGAFILGNFLDTESILRGVFHHHDRFDGLGNASGRKAESIPVEGRILALANAYQHLLAQAKPWVGRQGVFSQLREMAGKSLDPQLVECLIRWEAEALDPRWKDSPS